jgi:hypothetical protein
LVGDLDGDLLRLLDGDSDRDSLGDFDGLLDGLLEGDLDEDLLGDFDGDIDLFCWDSLTEIWMETY